MSGVPAVAAQSPPAPAAPSPAAAAPSPSSPPVPQRRTQRQRRAESRQRLLDATCACLVEHGYAGTTTVAITRRAGLSNGALFNQFASREELIVAAVRHLVDQADGALDDDVIAAVRSAPRPIAAAVELVWLGMFVPSAVATVELYVAARTNPEIRSALAEIEPAYRARMVSVTASMFPDLADWEHLPALVSLVRTSQMGAAITTQATGDDGRFAEARALLADAIEALVAGARAT